MLFDSKRRLVEVFALRLGSVYQYFFLQRQRGNGLTARGIGILITLLLESVDGSRSDSGLGPFTSLILGI